MKPSLLLIVLCFSARIASSQSVTWSGQIAELVYKNCTSCHHSGGIAPFSMMSYQQSYNNRFKIRSAVSNKIMPPWPPDNGYRRHAFNRSLKDEDIRKFENWVDAGAPSGDLTKAPAAPVYDNLGYIKNPDLIITAPKYTISSNVDEYRCFPDSTRLTKDMWMTALECIPGDPEIVHHVLIFRDRGVKSYSLDSKQEGPGYICFGGAGTNDADLIAAWVPGSGAFALPAGFGMKIPARSNIIIQVHYPAGVKGRVDQTKVKFKLTDQPQREAFLLPALNHELSLTNGPLIIPANTIKTFNQRFFLPFPASIIGVAPHMHLIGKSIKTWAVSNDLKEIPLISIPNWDFHWQGVYMFPQIQRIPAGSFLFSEAVYDNTASNHHNPNSPPKEIRVGEATTDEMMITYFLFAQYQAGDENYIIDSNAVRLTTEIKTVELKQREIKISPNPSKAASTLQLSFTTENQDKVNISVFDINGHKLWHINKSYLFASLESYDLPLHQLGLSPGVYIIKIQGATWSGIEKLIIN